ncbi:hypothetical protein FRB91_005633 [Serendipita sp. 411]|nr:hypothetical protein FRB91_005633 [Serendipita sp. 411]
MVVRGEEDMEIEMEMEQEEMESGSGSAGSARTITSLVVFPPMTIATATAADMESAPIQGKQEEMEVVPSY